MHASGSKDSKIDASSSAVKLASAPRLSTTVLGVTPLDRRGVVATRSRRSAAPNRSMMECLFFQCVQATSLQKCSYELFLCLRSVI